MDFITQCYDIMVTKGDFLNKSCIRDLVSKTLSSAILIGGALLQVPQIINILRSKSVAGLSLFSLYSQVFIPITFITYNLHKGNPISTWGENIFALIQNLIIVFCFWQLSKPSISLKHKIIMIFGFIGLAAGCMSLKEDLHFLLPLSCLPLLVTSRLPQIWANYQNKHTGPLSAFSFMLILGGSAARCYTTLIEVGLDLNIMSSYLLGGFFAAILWGQCLYYGGAKANHKAGKQD